MDHEEPVANAGAVEHTWRVTAYLYAPMLSTSPTPPQVGTPLTFASRLAPKAINYEGMAVALLPSLADVSATHQLPPGVELVFLAADLVGPFDALQAVESAIEVFEIIIDSLSFELGAVIRAGQFEVIDITAPAHVDDERELRVFSGPPYGTNICSVEMESIHGAVQVTLPDKVPQYDARTAAALRWFNKSMSTNLLHDVFIFLWIALEILVDLSPVSVEASYQARCNHLIRHCPECGSSTAKEVRGPTIRQYLEVSFGVDPQVARDLWRMRQMMHGSINFEPAKLHDLPTLVQPLRASVAEGIKRRLGIAAYAAPIIASSGLSINPAMGVEGTRKLTADDLQSLLDKIPEPVDQPGSGSRNSEPENVASTAAALGILTCGGMPAQWSRA